MMLHQSSRGHPHFPQRDRSGKMPMSIAGCAVSASLPGPARTAISDTRAMIPGQEGHADPVTLNFAFRRKPRGQTQPLSFDLG
jgi:hypothetical protein